jgi:hypothetical protein
MYFPDETILLNAIFFSWRHVLTLTRVATVPFHSWQRHAHAEELGFRDFSSLFLVKENRRQLGNSACCISFMKVSLTSRVFAMDEAKVVCNAKS